MAPIGTGPFKVVEFKPGDVGVYERNPLHRNADQVYFDEVIMKGGGDATSAARAVLQTGDYDFAGMLQNREGRLGEAAGEHQQGEDRCLPQQLYHAYPSESLKPRSEIG